MKRLIVFIFLISLSSFAFASNNDGAFLANGFGARPAALNNSFVARADDCNAIYWNPAGLTQVKGLEIQSMFYNAWETNYMSLQSAFALGELHIGLGYLGAGVNDILTTIPNSQIPGRYMVDSGKNFKYQGQTFFLSSAYKVLPELSLGTTFKYLTENLASNKAQGIGVDLGLLYNVTDYASLGLNIQNLYQPKMKWDTESENTDTIPILIKTGAAVLLFDDTLGISSDLDYLLRDINNEDRIKVYTGIEWRPVKTIALRLGLNPMQMAEVNRMISSYGAGLYLGVFNLDFSWTNQHPNLDIDEIEDIYRFSIGFNIEEFKKIAPSKKATEKEVVGDKDDDVINEEQFIKSINNTKNIKEIVVEDKKKDEVVVKEILESKNVVAQKNGLLKIKLNAPEIVKAGTKYTFEIIGEKPSAEYLVDFYIKDSYGAKVKKLISGQLLEHGVYNVVWDGTDDIGKKVEDGTYYLRIYATSANTVVSNFTKVNLIK